MIFDGANRRVILEASDGDVVEVDDIYSEWKRWVLDEDGSQYPVAFSTFGGDPLGGGVFAGAYFFLNTDDGWLIRPREASHNLQINGNLYPLVAGEEMFADTVGSWRIQVRLQTSSLTQAISTAGATPPTSGEVADAVWEHSTALELTAAVELIRRITDNRLEVDFDRQLLVLYDDDGVTEIRTWELQTDQGEDVTFSLGVQTKRGASIIVPMVLDLSGTMDGFTLDLSGDQAGFTLELSGDQSAV
jgi:hypothetical protein